MNRTQLIEHLEWSHNANAANVASMTAKLAETNDPLYELSWASGLVTAAAWVSVIRPYLKALNDGVEFATLHEQLRTEVLRGARSPERSTSPMHNICAQEALSIRAHILEMFNEVEA